MMRQAATFPIPFFPSPSLSLFLITPNNIASTKRSEAKRHRVQSSSRFPGQRHFENSKSVESVINDSLLCCEWKNFSEHRTKASVLHRIELPMNFKCCDVENRCRASERECCDIHCYYSSNAHNFRKLIKRHETIRSKWNWDRSRVKSCARNTKAVLQINKKFIGIRHRNTHTPTHIHSRVWWMEEHDKMTYEWLSK